MAREIKFRAWDSKKQCMDYGSNSLVFDYYDMVEPACIMQYTGLKDVAGKEIYEGDILGIENATAKVVFWEVPPEFGLDHQHNSHEWCDDWSLADDHFRMEIIGNAYEHPNLLKEDHESINRTL